jgi:hypothetical protein
MLSLVLLKASHAGPEIYYFFVIVGWPFFYYDQHGTLGALAISGLVQLIFVSAVQFVLSLLWRVWHKS